MTNPPCSNCELRGQMKQCESSGCPLANNWYVEQLKKRLAQVEVQHSDEVERFDFGDAIPWVLKEQVRVE